MPEGKQIRQRVCRLQEGLGDLDAVVATSQENTYYLSGTYIATVRLIPNRLAMLLIPQNDGPSFVVCNIEESLVRKQSPHTDVRPYVEFKESPVDLLAEAVVERGLERGRIGIEAKHLPSYYHKKLQKLLPKAQIEPADRLFDVARAVKGEEEIRALRQGAEVTENAIYAAWEQARPGETERSIAENIMGEMVKGGAETLSFMCFAGGVRCSHAHPIPGDYRLAAGDLARVDVGGLFQNYQSDVARTGILGKSTAKHRKYYGAVFEAQDKVIRAMRPGTPAKDLYALCKRTIEDHGISFWSPHIGHSVGIGLHEEPILHPYNDMRLEENMTFYVEPFILVTGRSAYHVEDLVQVTADGGDTLTDPDGLRQALYDI